MTHSDLVESAARWLRCRAAYWSTYGRQSVVRQTKCAVVLTELMTSTGETPDAIGWAFCGTMSVLVECKASRSDFLADRNKSHRYNPRFGMGKFRYYLAPEGIIAPSELPDRWGLLKPRRASAEVVWAAREQEEFNRSHEFRMLWSALRRAQTNGQTESE